MSARELWPQGASSEDTAGRASSGPRNYALRIAELSDRFFTLAHCTWADSALHRGRSELHLHCLRTLLLDRWSETMNPGRHLCCVLLIACSCAVTCFAEEASGGTTGQDNTRADKRIVPQIAIDHALRGDYKSALPYYREAVNENPDSGEKHHALGCILLSAKQLDEAISELEEAIRLEPNNARYHRGLGWTFATKGDREQSRHHFDTAIQLSPDDAKNWVELGKFQYATGDFPSAIKTFTKALEISATAEARLARASAYRRNRQFKESIADCDEILTDSRDDYKALTCRAFSRMRRGNLEGASQDAERVIAARETTANVGYLVRGCVRYTRKEFDPAIGDLSMSIDLAPREPLAYVMRAVVHFSQNRKVDAMSDLDDAIKLSSSPQRLNYELDGFGYQVYKFRGLLRTCFAREHKKAIEDLNQAIALNGKDSECFTLRGIAHSNDSNARRALADFEKAIELRQDDDLANFLLVNILTGSPDDKLRDGKRSIELAHGLNDRHRNQPVILSYLAGAHSEAGEFEEAEKMQLKVLEQLVSSKQSSTFSTYFWWGITYNFHFSPSLKSNQELLELYKQKKPFRLAEKRSVVESTLVP